MGADSAIHARHAVVHQNQPVHGIAAGQPLLHHLKGLEPIRGHITSNIELLKQGHQGHLVELVVVDDQHCRLLERRGCNLLTSARALLVDDCLQLLDEVVRLDDLSVVVLRSISAIAPLQLALLMLFVGGLAEELHGS